MAIIRTGLGRALHTQMLAMLTIQEERQLFADIYFFVTYGMGIVANARFSFSSFFAKAACTGKPCA
eukprot:scaffold6408_cov17-Prasinocladus_malaysianus.AAC.2